jgi:hypothetical protein
MSLLFSCFDIDLFGRRMYVYIEIFQSQYLLFMIAANSEVAHEVGQLHALKHIQLLMSVTIEREFI